MSGASQGGSPGHRAGVLGALFHFSRRHPPAALEHFHGGRWRGLTNLGEVFLDGVTGFRAAIGGDGPESAKVRRYTVRGDLRRFR